VEGSRNNRCHKPVAWRLAVGYGGQSSLVEDPTIRLPSFDLQRRQWSLLNSFRTGQGHCNACHKKWVSLTMNYVTVVKPKQCHISSTLVHWPSLTADYCAYMKQMRRSSTGWQHMTPSIRQQQQSLMSLSVNLTMLLVFLPTLTVGRNRSVCLSVCP